MVSTCSSPLSRKNSEKPSANGRRIDAYTIASAAVAAALPTAGFDFTFGDDPEVRKDLQTRVEAALIARLDAAEDSRESLDPPSPPGAPKAKLGAGTFFTEFLPLATEAIDDIVDDSFSQCFETHHPRRWNWGYLLPFYLLGGAFRYLVLFPLRLVFVVFASLVLIAFMILLPRLGVRLSVSCREQAMVTYAQALLLGFGAVVTYHGSRPRVRAGVVYAANHTTMLDYLFLLGVSPFSVVGQKHTGLVGFMQNNLFDSLQCVWFQRSSTKDRALVRHRIASHVESSASPPLCVFPEGTCVNNRFCLLFKQGLFELENTSVVPVSIYFDRSFATGFWDSRKCSFVSYLARIMTQWCIVVDITFLPPETRGVDEDPREFAGRVKDIIATQARLTPVPYDGYLKHSKPSKRYVESRQKKAVPTVLAYAN